MYGVGIIWTLKRKMKKKKLLDFQTASSFLLLKQTILLLN